MRNAKQKVVTILIVVYLISLIFQAYMIYSISGMAIAGQQQQGTVSLTLLTPLYITGNLNADGQSVDINWTDMVVALHYNIYYSENISAIMTLDINSIPPGVYNFSSITNNYFTDTTANQSQKRYYTVSYVTNSGEELSTDIPLAKYTYYYDIFNSSSYGILASNRISLYLNANYSAESFLQEIPSGLNPTLSRLAKSNPSGEYIITHVRGLNDGNNFQIIPSEGYLLTLDNYHNHSIVGKVYHPPYTLYYDIFNSTAYGILASNWKGVYDTKKIYSAENFLQEIPGGLNPTISELRKSDSSGEYLITHVRGLNDGNNFSMFIGKSYIVTVDNYYNHTLCNSYPTCFG